MQRVTIVIVVVTIGRRATRVAIWDKYSSPLLFLLGGPFITAWEVCDVQLSSGGLNR